MTNRVIPALYGASNANPVKNLTEASNEFEIKTQGKNFVQIKNGKENVDVPRAQFVKLLEDKVEQQAREVKRLQSDNKKLKSVVDSLLKDVNDLRKELKTKMDRF